MNTDNSFEIQFTVILVVMILVIAVCAGAIWNQDVPKVQPDKAKFLLAKAGEGIRNIADHNSIEYKVCVKASAELNKYIRNFRCDVDRDGNINDTDVNLVQTSKGLYGNGMRIEDIK